MLSTNKMQISSACVRAISRIKSCWWVNYILFVGNSIIAAWAQLEYWAPSPSVLWRVCVWTYECSSSVSCQCFSAGVVVWLYRLNQYEDRCHWLKDANFLRDLESDSVDSDILDEELRSLELHEQKTWVLQLLVFVTTDATSKTQTFS